MIDDPYGYGSLNGLGQAIGGQLQVTSRGSGYIPGPHMHSVHDPGHSHAIDVWHAQQQRAEQEYRRYLNSFGPLAEVQKQMTSEKPVHHEELLLLL